jgi:hypothetical protein
MDGLMFAQALVVQAMIAFFHKAPAGSMLTNFQGKRLFKEDD